MSKALIWIGGATLATVLLFGGALVLAILQSLGFAPWFGVNTFPDFSYFGALWGSSTFWVSLGLTLYYATVSTVIALILGILLALALVKTFPSKTFYKYLYKLPLMIPYTVGIALAVLMPIVASMGGNAGTQSLTVAVRAIATKDLTGANVWRVIRREVLVGLVNGVIFAVVMGIVGLLWFGSPALGYVIAAAMVINLVVAGLAGTVIPVLLERVGVDPALASGAFVTTVTDVVGFFAFLGLAVVVLL